MGLAAFQFPARFNAKRGAPAFSGAGLPGFFSRSLRLLLVILGVQSFSAPWFNVQPADLRRAFPNIRFIDGPLWWRDQPTLRFIDSIAAATSAEVSLLFPSDGWQPQFAEARTLAPRRLVRLGRVLRRCT